MVTDESPHPHVSSDREQLRTLLVDGMDCGPGPDLDAAYFDRLRDWIRADGNRPGQLPSGAVRRRAPLRHAGSVLGQ